MNADVTRPYKEEGLRMMPDYPLDGRRIEYNIFTFDGERQHDHIAGRSA